MEQPQEGGSYTRDPKTGKLTLVHRTEGNAVWAKPSLADEQASEAVAPPAATPATSKPEKA